MNLARRALVVLLAPVLACGGGEGHNTSSETSSASSETAMDETATDETATDETATDETATDETATDETATDETDPSESDTGETDTGGDEPCTDDADCEDLGLICNEGSGECVAPDCAGEPDFTLCETVTMPDRGFDICVDETCVSPGCGELGCNAPAPHFTLADTNQRDCYDNLSVSDCPMAGEAFHGQDAQYGWDTTHTAPERFTRNLDVRGEPVVSDHVTALIWQGCSLGLSGDDCATGVATQAGWAEQVASCDALSWGGHDDWRLADVYELQTLVNQGTSESPTIDPAVFPATQLNWYWSMSSSLDPDWAWTVHFGFGTVASDFKPNARSARCVRAGALQPRHFEVSMVEADRIVTDTQSGVIFQGCTDGTAGSDCDGFPSWSTWEAALDYCETLTWAGFDDWRLPDLNELHSIVDYDYESLSVDPQVFPGLSHSAWTSTTRPSFPNSAMAVNFEYGTTFSLGKTEMAGAVRCIRSP